MMTAEECVKAGKITSADQYMVPDEWYGYSACSPKAAKIPMHDIHSFVMMVPFFIVGMDHTLRRLCTNGGFS
jgi:hypothetical protein